MPNDMEYSCRKWFIIWLKKVQVANSWLDVKVCFRLGMMPKKKFLHFIQPLFAVCQKRNPINLWGNVACVRKGLWGGNGLRDYDWEQSLEETLGAFQECIPFEKPNRALFWGSGHFEHRVSMLVGCSSSPGGNIWKMQLPLYVFKQLSFASEEIIAFQLPQ